jgi:hypothetical protein
MWRQPELIPDSLFLRVVPPSNYQTLNSGRASYPRASDKAIVYRQNPVGWLFFSQPHIDTLLSDLSIKLPGIRLEDILPTMVRIYDTHGRDTYVDHQDKSTVDTMLRTMDTALATMMMDMAQRNEMGRQYYATYLMNPNRDPDVPMATSDKNRRTIATASTTGTSQGGHFNPMGSSTMQALTAYNVRPPTVQPIIKYS